MHVTFDCEGKSKEGEMQREKHTYNARTTAGVKERQPKGTRGVGTKCQDQTVLQERPVRNRGVNSTIDETRDHIQTNVEEAIVKLLREWR